MNLKNKQYIIFAALLFVYLLSYFCHIINYETNDDSLMNMISSGYWLGEPNEFLVQINIFLSLFLKYLYAHFPSINWYFMMLFVTQFVAWNLILKALLEKTILGELIEKDKRFWLVIIAIVVLFTVPLLLKIQFTSTAFLIGFAGLLTLWKIEKQAFLQQFIVFLCIVMAGLLRFQVGLFILGVSLFFIDYQAVRRYLFVIVFAIIAVAFLKLTHAVIYAMTSPSFEEWQQSNEQIMNNFNHNDAEHLTKAGFSEADWRVFKSWFWFDGMVFNKEKIIRVATQLQRAATPIEIIKRGGRLLIDQSISLAILAVLIAFFYRQTKSKVLQIRSLAFFGFIGFFLLFLIVFQRIPTRVTTPTFLLVFLFLLLNIDYEALIQLNFATIKKISLTIFTFTALAQAVNIFGIIKENVAYRSAFTNHQTLFSSHRDQLFLGLGSEVPMEGMPMELNPVSYSSFNFLPLGWSEFTPPFNTFFTKWHINHLPFELLKNDIFIVGQKEGFNDDLKAFYEQHYQRKIKVVESPSISNDIFIEQIRPEQ
jgi:hypothetical protein